MSGFKIGDRVRFKGGHGGKRQFHHIFPGGGGIGGKGREGIIVDTLEEKTFSDGRILSPKLYFIDVGDEWYNPPATESELEEVEL